MCDESHQDSRHFDMKDIVKAEKAALVKKKNRKLKKKLEETAAQQSEFSVDVKDPRFSMVFEEPTFAIDPTNSQ
jgi:hypothetical protein